MLRRLLMHLAPRCLVRSGRRPIRRGLSRQAVLGLERLDDRAHQLQARAHRNYQALTERQFHAEHRDRTRSDVLGEDLGLALLAEIGEIAAQQQHICGIADLCKQRLKNAL